MTMDSPSTSPHNRGASSSTARLSANTPSPRCSQCSRTSSENARNIVVCIDGTSNQFGQKNTNVVKLFSKIDLGTTKPAQCAFYSSGIGTRPTSLRRGLGGRFSDYLGLAIAWNLEEIVKDAYDWLARTYREGDQIYLFGFSRGAYQVQVLAAMIHEVGLIREPTERQIGAAYDHYHAIRLNKSVARKSAREFRKTFSWQYLRVHFIGVWDTVSSVGFGRSDVSLAISSAAYACHFRHALALDERRVKFMPEYFHRMNSQMHGREVRFSTTSRQRDSAIEIDDISGFSAGHEHQTAVIKEVWFAGSHSDVGGVNIPGESYHAGKISLLWMHREAAASGLVLKPAEIVWVPADLDFGTRDSMDFWWQIAEGMPIKHQTSFSGAGEDSRRWHLSKPRRIIPGQKIHASILYANIYKPRVTLGRGFDMPIIMHLGRENPDLRNEIWETGLSADMIARDLLAHLRGQQRISPIFLHGLLFLMRFKEEKQRVRNVDGFQDWLKALIMNPQSRYARLVSLVVYYEVAYDTGKEKHAPSADQFEDDIYNDARTSLVDIVDERKNRDGANVVAILSPLIRHKVLREHILTTHVIDKLADLLDLMSARLSSDFSQAMEGLNCLLQCESTRDFFVGKLKEPFLGYRRSRLSRILGVDDAHLLAAALRMVLTLVRTPEAVREVEVEEERREATGPEEADNEFWSDLKHWIRRLVRRRSEQLVIHLAVEILFALNDMDGPNQPSTCNPRIPADGASAFVLKPEVQYLAERGWEVNPDQLTFRRLSRAGSNTGPPEPSDVKLVEGLQRAVRQGNPQKRTTATLALLELCKTRIIRNHLLKTGLLDVFIDQLQHRSSALLAAYALATCLQYKDVKHSNSIKDNNLLPKYIVKMLLKDYFDDAVGQIEGFRIFKDLMQHDDLRKKIKSYDITQLLDTKLRKGNPKETRTGLISLDTFLSFDPDGPWTKGLVKKSLAYLTSGAWEEQKAGVMILSALAQTKYGTELISNSIPDIIDLLLLRDYQRIGNQTTTSQPASNEHLPRNDEPPLAQETTQSTDSLLIASSPGPSWMMGPACALWILSHSKPLQEKMRTTREYSALKYLHVNGMLVDSGDTPPWRVKTPNRADVIYMLNNVIQAIDEVSEHFTSDSEMDALPSIEHWDRLARPPGRFAMAVLSPVVAPLAILVIILGTPIYLCDRAYMMGKCLWSERRDNQILDNLRGGQAKRGSHRDDDPTPSSGLLGSGRKKSWWVPLGTYLGR